MGYDFSRVGIDGFRADLKGATGLSEDAGPHATFDRSEYNLNMYYDFQGAMKGWSLLNRLSYQEADESRGGRDGYQVRLRRQYNF